MRIQTPISVVLGMLLGAAPAVAAEPLPEICVGGSPSPEAMSELQAAMGETRLRAGTGCPVRFDFRTRNSAVDVVVSGYGASAARALPWSVGGGDPLNMSVDVGRAPTLAILIEGLVTELALSSATSSPTHTATEAVPARPTVPSTSPTAPVAPRAPQAASVAPVAPAPTVETPRPADVPAASMPVSIEALPAAPGPTESAPVVSAAPEAPTPASLPPVPGSPPAVAPIDPVAPPEPPREPAPMRARGPISVTLGAGAQLRTPAIAAPTGTARFDYGAFFGVVRTALPVAWDFGGRAVQTFAAGAGIGWTPIVVRRASFELRPAVELRAEYLFFKRLDVSGATSHGVWAPVLGADLDGRWRFRNGPFSIGANVAFGWSPVPPMVEVRDGPSVKVGGWSVFAGTNISFQLR